MIVGKVLGLRRGSNMGKIKCPYCGSVKYRLIIDWFFILENQEVKIHFYLYLCKNCYKEFNIEEIIRSKNNGT